MSLYNLSEREYRKFITHCYFDEEGVLRWGGAIDKSKGSYGVVRLRGSIVYAHRIAMDLWGDVELKRSDLVLHKVHGKENRNIIDVQELYIGNTVDNMRDRDEAGRACRGVMQWQNTLTEAQVIEIYDRSWGTERGIDLAQEFDVVPSVISCIKHGRAWGWLTGHQREAIAAD